MNITSNLEGSATSMEGKGKLSASLLLPPPPNLPPAHTPPSLPPSLPPQTRRTSYTCTNSWTNASSISRRSCKRFAHNTTDIGGASMYALAFIAIPSSAQFRHLIFSVVPTPPPPPLASAAPPLFPPPLALLPPPPPPPFAVS